MNRYSEEEGTVRKYRVNDSEHFNLLSMYDKLKCLEIDMQEAPAGTYTEKQGGDLGGRMREGGKLIGKGNCVCGLGGWATF